LASLRQFGLACEQSPNEVDRLTWPSLLERHLACWTDLLPLGQLHRAYFTALPIGILLGALTWRRILTGLPPDRRFDAIYPDPRQVNYAVAANLRRILRWADADESTPWHTIL
jgi:hypothetical protein